jgi:trehalose 6-phosphate synthase
VSPTTDRLSRPELLGLYREADLAVVSPLRDGLNLVALEYVAAQTGPPGVLVLSQTAGIHDLLGGPAVSVNPLDSTAFSTALDFALRMPTEQRRRRMEALERTVSENDLSTWIDSYLERPQPPERAYARQ